MRGWVRAAGIRDLLPLLQDLGVDSAGLLARVGLSVADLEAPDGVITLEAAAAALESAAVACGRPDLGLLVAERQTLRVIGPVSVAVQSARTLGDAVAVAAQYLFTHSPAMRLRIASDDQADPGVLAVSFAVDGIALSTVPQSVDSALGTMHRIASAIHGPYGLVSVHLPHRALAPAGRYQDFFGAAVHFEADAAYLRVRAEMAGRPLRDSDQMVSTMALHYLSDKHAVPDSLGADVRLAVSAALTDGEATLSAIAGRMGMHHRTLQRRLADQGLRFHDLLDEVRRDLARQLLIGTDLPLRTVAARVGFAEQSALARAVRRWFGCTPRALRSRGRRPGRDL